MPGSREQLAALTDFPLNMCAGPWLLYLLRRNDPIPRRRDNEYSVASYLIYPGTGTDSNLREGAVRVLSSAYKMIHASSIFSKGG
jgi:hypothetical protein